MRRRLFIVSAMAVAMLLVAADSVLAARCFDRLLSRCRVRCCAPVCKAPSACEPAACEPAACGPVKVMDVAPTEGGEEGVSGAVTPDDTPPVDPPTVPPDTTDPPVVDPPVTDPPVVDPPVVDPPVVDPPVVEPPVVDPMDEPPVVEPPVVDPMDEPPVVDPMDEPPVVDPPAVDPLDAPPTDPPAIEDDPFGSNESNGLRLWTDASGKYQVSARFVSVIDETTVRLQKDDGRYVRVAMDRLSLTDQQVVRGELASLAGNL